MTDPSPAPAAAPPSRKLAIASLVCGLLFCIPLLPALAALVLGIMALMKKNQGGKGMAIAGVVLGGVSLLMIPILAAIAIPGMVNAKRAAGRQACQSNIRTILTAGMSLEMDEARPPRGLDELVQGGKLEAHCLDCRSDPGTSGDYAMVPFERLPTACTLWVYCKEPSGHGDRIPCGFTDGTTRLLTREEFEAELQAAQSPQDP